MRRQRRKRHGKRGRAVLKRREQSLGRQQVPQWTAGGVRQHQRPGVSVSIKRLLSQSAGPRIAAAGQVAGLGNRVQGGGVARRCCCSPVAQGLPAAGSHSSVFVPAVFGCRQEPRVFRLYRRSRHVSAFGYAGLQLDVNCMKVRDGTMEGPHT